VPRVLVTDKLASYTVAHRYLLGSVEHRRSKYLNIGPRTRTNRPGSASGR
jgi:transposase-like protein